MYNQKGFGWILILCMLFFAAGARAQMQDIAVCPDVGQISSRAALMQNLDIQEISFTLDPGLSAKIRPGFSAQIGEIDRGVAGAWQTVLSEDFEGAWPGSWTVQDNDSGSGSDNWAPVTCGPTPTSGSYTCWCAGSGDMTPCASYDTYQQSWMVYGPFSLSSCQDAEVWFNMMNDSESGYDSLNWGVSIDGSMFYGYFTDGTTSGYPSTWYNTEFDLTSVPTLGDICGEQNVWFAFIFVSDVSYTYGGAYLDDVLIQKEPNEGTPLPDLEPYQVPGWDDTLVVANVTGTTTSSAAIYDDETVYLDYSCINSGPADANEFYYGIWVDDIHRKYVHLSSGLQAGYYSYVLDSDLGTLPAGWRTITIKCDYDFRVNESDETDNEYSRDIYIYERDPNAQIHGFKWNDIDEDGLWDPEEPALSDWFIYLDLDQDCEWDAGEPYYITGPDGAYHFTGLQAGTYIVAEVLPEEPNCLQTYPVGAAPSSSMMAAKSTRADLLTPQEKAKIGYQVQDSPPYPPQGIARSVVSTDQIPQSVVMLSDVPTSTWTYGCSATSAGMLFGYYDRTGYADMYTGPANGGVCPLTDLGQGIGIPIPGSCSIIATQNGFDGRVTNGHVDDYWISTNSPGPDPWEGSWPEHTWEGCTADFMGTNQWKWDFIGGDLIVDSNKDGATTFFYWTDGSKMYDYIPPASAGTPQTALCHGMRLFTESRGYTVVENYNQLTDNQHASGFTFEEYMDEIDAGRPILIQVTGHTMTGVGYEQSTNTIYIHDTWDNLVHTMQWGDEYSGMDMIAVTAITLEAAPGCPGTHTVELTPGQVIEDLNFGNHCPGCGDWGYFLSDLNRDCYVNLKDLAAMALEWLLCSHPDDPTCIHP